MVKKIEKKKESFDSLEEFEIVAPSKALLDSVTIATNANNSKIKVDEGRLKELKLVLGYLNAYIKSFGTKANYFKLVGMEKRVAAFKTMEAQKKKKRK